MAAVECAIWKTSAQLLESAGEFQVFDSPRAGGKYWISGTAIGQVLSFNDHAKRLLTTWICEQRRAGGRNTEGAIACVGIDKIASTATNHD